MLRQTFILIVAGAFTANAQTLVGSLGAMGIAGTLQSINSTAAINGLNAANGVTGINAQQNAAVNQALNGTPPQGSNAGNVTGSVTINGVTQALGTAPGGLPGMGGGLPGMGGMGVDPVTGLPISTPGGVAPGLPGVAPGGLPGMGGGVTPPPSRNHHSMLAGNIRVLTVPFQAASSTGRHRGGILRMVGGYGGFRVSPRLGRSAPASRSVASSVASTASARAQGSSISISSLRVSPSRTYRRNVRMGFRLQ
ncbi:MAG: hypothetical protein ACPGQC_11200 [Limisphaerales bacterium]